MRVRHVLPLLILMALHGTATAGIDDTYNRAGPSLWSTGFYIRLVGRNIFQKSIAVVVGVGDYDRFPRLSAPAADALRVRDFLRDDAGFDQIITLTDEKATYARIAELMEKVIPDALGQNDRFLFYFSGHGVTRSLAMTKRGYLVLKKSARGDWQDMIDMERLKQWTENVAQARHSLFLLDACFSGLAAFEAKAGDVREKTIARLTQPGHYIVTAGTEGEETYIYKGESLFTQAFLSAARGEGMAVSDGVVSLNEMMTRVNRILDARQAEIGDKIRMTPRQYQARISNNAGEFFFLPRGRPEVSIANTQTSPRSEPKTGSDAVAVAAVPEPTAPTVPMRSFAMRSGMVASGSASGSLTLVGSIGECEQKCAQSTSCNVFTYSRVSRACYVYARADLAPNEYFDSGVRYSATSINSQLGPGAAPFEIRNGMVANGSAAGTTYLVGSKSECEHKCSQSVACNVFTYSRGSQLCYLYARADLVSNQSFDSGFRK
jgi:hypothetical protein